jgi:hypothetical protein
MKQTRNVARTLEIRKTYTILVGMPERDYLGDLDEDGKIILK